MLGLLTKTQIVFDDQAMTSTHMLFRRQLPLVLWLTLNGEAEWIEPFILVRQHQRWDEYCKDCKLTLVQCPQSPMSEEKICTKRLSNKCTQHLRFLNRTQPDKLVQALFKCYQTGQIWLQSTSNAKTGCSTKGEEIRSICSKDFIFMACRGVKNQDWSREEGH